MRRRHAATSRVRPPGPGSGGASSRPSLARWPALALLAGLAASPLGAQTLMTQEEALAVAFPVPVEVERRTAYLSEEQLDRVRELAGAGVDIESGIVTYYVGTRDGEPTGAAYFDAHRVRTKNEVVMVVVDPDARVRRVDVLKFMEPAEYRAPEGWIEQLEDRRLNDELSTRGAIRNLTGATLTARALTEAARRVLALHAVIGPFRGAGAP